MAPFLGHQCWYSFDDKTPLLGAKAVMTDCVHANLFFFLLLLWTLKDCIPDSLICFVLTSYKTAENCTALHQFLSFREVVYWAITLSCCCLDAQSCLTLLGSNKTLFYSYYRLFIGGFHWQSWSQEWWVYYSERSLAGNQLWGQSLCFESQHRLQYLLWSFLLLCANCTWRLFSPTSYTRVLWTSFCCGLSISGAEGVKSFTE